MVNQPFDLKKKPEMRTLGECYNPKASCLLSQKNVHCHVNKKLKNVHSSFPEGKNLKRLINLGYLGTEASL